MVSYEIQIILSFVAVAIFIALILTLNFRKQDQSKALIWILIIIFGVLMTVIVVFDMISNGIEIIDSTSDSWHVGLILGLPALISLSIGTILVLYDEHKYVVWHGYFAGGSLIVTIINVILLVFLTPTEILNYSGMVHTLHIMLGATGLMTGSASFLFGAAGQRNLARLTGYFTLSGWWGAFLLGLFL
ncbi:MAG: hypothetical protein HWN80_15070 [Candidatus Lokiarchaeota archaeon]|nr:hypothetical protein [Candidatus Lokiarchaeota archaeon]